MAKTANELYFSAALRRQIAVRKYTASEIRRILLILEHSDQELTNKIRERLAKLGQVTDFTSKRYLALLADIQDLRSAVLNTLKRQVTRDLGTLGEHEAEAETKLLRASIPVEISFAKISADAIRAIVDTQPFQGHLLNDWFTGLRQADRRALTRALQLGLAQGESIPDIVKRVAGTKANNFSDGALSITRRNAEAVVRTGVNHVSNAARETVWDANADIIQALRWTSTLDGRTTPICQARDGMLAPVGDKPLPEDAELLDPPDARPPAHVGCRSIMVAVIDGMGVVGSRPYVMSTQRPGEREADFRAEARQTGEPIGDIRARWADENIGQVAAKTTYNDWLKSQPAAFQDEVLGADRGELFRSGGVTLDQFVEPKSGKLIKLEDLAP